MFGRKEATEKMIVKLLAMVLQLVMINNALGIGLLCLCCFYTNGRTYACYSVVSFRLSVTYVLYRKTL